MVDWRWLAAGALSGPGPFLVMVVPDGGGLRVAGLDGSGYGDAGFGRFIESWGGALQQVQAQVGRAPDQPGLARSVFNLVSAILRTAAGAAGGLIQGVVATL